MIRKISGTFLLAAALAAVSASDPATASTGFVNFMIGQKSLDDAPWAPSYTESWSPIQVQSAFGVESAFGSEKWPVLIAAYFARSSDSKDTTFTDPFGEPYIIHLQGTTQEIGIGVNKTLTIKRRIFPYLSAGGMVATVNETAKQSGVSVERASTKVGLWASFATFYRLGTRFNIGGLARYSDATVEFEESVILGQPAPAADVPEGGWTYGVILGWGWPATK